MNKGAMELARKIFPIPPLDGIQDQKGIDSVTEAVEKAQQDYAALIDEDIQPTLVAAEKLADAEQQYRGFHDIHGSGNILTGRAWDLMRKAGEEFREALAKWTDK